MTTRQDGETRSRTPAKTLVSRTEPRASFVSFAHGRSAAARYGVAIGLTLVAAALTVALADELSRTAFLIFWPVVIWTAWYGGFGPALVSSVIAVLTVDYFIFAPVGSLQLFRGDELLPLAALVALAAIISALAQSVETARRKATEAATERGHLAEQLESQAMELEQQLEEAQSLQEELEHSTEELAQRTAEAEAAERFSRGILESIAEPFVVQDGKWRFRYVNQAAAEIFNRDGHDRSALTGKVVWDVYPAVLGTDFEKSMRRAMETRQPVSAEAFYPETGEWSAMFCYPLPDGGLATQWRDITARKRAEESSRYLARASEALSSSLNYEETLNQLAQTVVPEFADWCGVDIVEEDGQVRQLAVAHVDPAKVRWAREIRIKYPPDPNAPTGVHNVVRTGEPELYPAIPAEMLEAGAKDAEHLRLIQELDLRSAMIVPLIARGRTLGALTLVTSESQRRYTSADLELAMELARRAALAVDNARLHRAELEARRAAENANLAKMQFLAVMSHELRTPLNAIAGYTELLLMGVRGPLTSEQQEDLQRITRSQRNLLSLINDVLNYAKLEAGHVEFANERVVIFDVLNDLEPLVVPLFTAKGLTYNVACDPQYVACGDAEKVRQILLNLLSNAIKFTKPGGSIDLACDLTDATVNVNVSDTGVGIPAEKVTAIFEPFVQLDRKLTSTHEGTGLGLAISRDLALGMGGDLAVTKSSPEGSTFTLSLRAI